MNFYEFLGFNLVNATESPTTMIVMIIYNIISSEFLLLNKSTSPNAQIPINRIGNKYFNVKIHVFPTFKVENSFNTGMTFSTPKNHPKIMA